MGNLISVIIPCRNGENYLLEAIAGIQRQNVLAEIIVVYNGSTDKTVRIAKMTGCYTIFHGISRGLLLVRIQDLKLQRVNI
jgi:glycosyltransferase involved in cell wall biosynthesis